MYKRQASGLPTTQGHDKYVNKNVFDVISSDTFGTKELESPLFDKTKGSSCLLYTSTVRNVGYFMDDEAH